MSVVFDSSSLSHTSHANICKKHTFSLSDRNNSISVGEIAMITKYAQGRLLRNCRVNKVLFLLTRPLYFLHSFTSRYEKLSQNSEFARNFCAIFELSTLRGLNRQWLWDMCFGCNTLQKQLCMHYWNASIVQGCNISLTIERREGLVFQTF